MHDPRRQPLTHTSFQTTVAVPTAQSRALDRRHSLDNQQRSFRGGLPTPHILRPRPPG